MDSEIMVEPLPLLGICNLCLNEGAVRSMLASHNYNGASEIYAEMLSKCFSIDITTLQLGDTKRLICEGCIIKLRNSATFRTLVETSLHTLEATVKLAENKTSLRSIVKQEFSEILDEADFDLDLSNLPEDNEEDYTLPIKQEKTEIKKPKPKTVKKLKKVSTQDVEETDTMLNQGLFPFKIKKSSVFSCSICPEKMSSLDDLKTHVCQHNKKNIHLAFKKMMYSDSYKFYKHQTKLRCKICTIDLENYNELKNHIEVDSCRIKLKINKWNILPFKLEKDQLDCPICKKKFLNYVSLNTHMNVHYPNYICESCGKAFASKARLRGHMRTHEEGTFPCKYCSAIFDRVTKRENHVSKEHKSGIRYACKRCNITLTSFYARQKHLAEIHNEELKRYKCKACPQSYITPGHLSSHVRRDHLNERNHKCDKCDLAFYTKNSLKMHMIKHDGERIHTCNVCQKSYQRKKTLREHMRIHTNDKRFVCPVCGRAFTQKCTLKGHLRVHERKVDLDDRIVQPLHSI